MLGDSSCRQLFRDVNVLPIASVYIIDVCYIEINKDNLEHNIEICSFNFCKFWSLMFSFITHVLEKV